MSRGEENPGRQNRSCELKNQLKNRQPEAEARGQMSRNQVSDCQKWQAVRDRFHTQLCQ